MSIGRYCTATVLLIVSIVLHVIEIKLFYDAICCRPYTDHLFAIPIVIFLFDIIYPAVTIFLMLEARGLI